MQPHWQRNQPAELTGETATERLVPLYQPIAEFVSAQASAGNQAVSFAGDCCTTIGVLAGLQRAGISPTLIWLDSHGDFNDWETTPSGFLGGMPLAWMAGIGEMTVMDGLGATPLPASQIILCDGRDLDPGEKVLVKDSGITHIRQLADLINYPLPDAPLWVHFDNDVLDSDEVPGIQLSRTEWSSHFRCSQIISTVGRQWAIGGCVNVGMDT